MKIGYARVSTDEQNLDLQRDALKAAGCSSIFEDRGISGSVRKRPALEQAIATLGTGDVLVVWKLDRLGRSLLHLIELMRDLEGRGVGFQSLSDSIDTTSAGGRLVFHVAAAFAEFERDLISERTRAGMKAAKERGGRIGRRRKLTAPQIDEAQRLLTEADETVANIAVQFSVSRSTLYRLLARHRARAAAETEIMSAASRLPV